ncbi:hypothetical protein RRG08_009514 [Elysia crispata]|uniref:Uncharacterized protein n=1 Tax=Elysia crispata TaxID=231223 RepID=A0AAE1B404_9GAST|nr:hypothetical protein RRG08_009514 [Elysia crispata]
MLTLSSALTGHRSTYSASTATSVGSSCGFDQGITSATRERFYGMRHSTRLQILPLFSRDPTRSSESCGKHASPPSCNLMVLMPVGTRQW